MPQLSAQMTDLSQRLKHVIRRDLKLGEREAIDDDMPLVGGEFDLDSLDILMLVTSIEKEFGVKISSEHAGRDIFATVASLTDYIASQTQTREDGADTPNETTHVAHHHALTQLPHQPPFRFISRLTVHVPGQQAAGVWDVTGEEDFIAGHFPGRPLVPGVLIAEALAQLSGLIASTGGNANNVPMAGMLAQVNVRFREPVVPPAEVSLHSRSVRVADTLHQYEVCATVAERVVAEGELTLHLVPKTGDVS